MSTDSHDDLIFTGDGSMTVDVFLPKLAKRANENGKLRDNDYMADSLCECLGGAAFYWYESLDEDTQQSWRKLKAGLIRRFSPHSSANHPPAASPPSHPPSVPAVSSISPAISAVEPIATRPGDRDVFTDYRAWQARSDDTSIKTFACTPKGVTPPRIALCSSNGTMYLYNTGTDEFESFKAMEWAFPSTIAFSPDGEYIAHDVPAVYPDINLVQSKDYAYSGLRSGHIQVRMLDGSPFKRIDRVRCGRSACFAFSPNDVSLAVLRDEYRIACVSIPDDNAKTDRLEIKSADRISLMLFIPNSPYLAVLLSAGIIKVYDWKDRQSPTYSINQNFALCMSIVAVPDRRLGSLRLLSAGGKTKNGQPWGRQNSIYIFESGSQWPDSSMLPLPLHAAVEGLAYSPNGKLMACRGSKIADSVWDVQRKSPVAMPSTLTDSPWNNMGFTEDGTLFVTLHEDGIIRLHQIDPTGEFYGNEVPKYAIRIDSEY